MFLCVLTGGVLAAQSFACDPLTLPVAPDAGGEAPPPVTTDGAVAPTPSTLPSFIPQGAKFGEAKEPPGFNAGSVYTWAVLDSNSKVTEVSWSLPLSMVRAVRGKDQRFAVIFPKEAVDQTVIRSLALNFYENGHIPPGVYDTPHWEFHPQSILEDQVQLINCADQTPPKEEAIPPEYLIPPVQAVPCMPLMGFHGFHSKAPEFNGERFRAGAHLLTWYHGNWSAFEPKLANEVMFKRETVVADLPWVPIIDKPALYPKKVTMEYHAGEDAYLFRITDFVPHE